MRFALSALLLLGAALVSATPNVAWTTSIGAPIKSTMSLVGFGKEKAKVVFSANDTLYALDRDTGKKVWNYTGTSELTAATVSEFDGIAFLGDADGAVHVVDILTGKMRWKKSITGAVFTTKPGLAITAFRKSVIIFGDDSGAIYAFDAMDGSGVWNHTFSGRSGTAVVAEKHVFVTYKPWNYLLCYNAENGTLVFNYSSTSIQSIPASLDDLIVYIGNEAGLFQALFVSTQKQIWNQTTAVLGTQPLVDQDIVVYGDATGYVWAFDAIFGHTKWGTQTNATANGINSIPAADRDNVYIGGSDGVMYALTRSNGTIAWTYDSGAPMEKNAPALDFFGRRMFFGNNGGDAVAINL